MTKHPDTQRIDDAHAGVVDALRAFQLDTATAGTLDTLRNCADAVVVAAEALTDAIDEAEDADAPDLYSGWLTTPATL